MREAKFTTFYKTIQVTAKHYNGHNSTIHTVENAVKNRRTMSFSNIL